MQVARKFLFDEFDNDPAEGAADAAVAPEPPEAIAPPEPVEEPPPPPEPTFSQAELDEAFLRGREEGRLDALAERSRAREDLVDLVLAALPEAFGRISHEFKSKAAELEREALLLTRAVLHKSVPTLMRHQAVAEIENIVRQCLRDNLHEPRIVLRVSDALFEAVEKQVLPLSKKAGFTGQWIMLADETVADGACRLEWADGGAERDPGHLLAEIEEAIARVLGGTPDLEKSPGCPPAPGEMDETGAKGPGGEHQ